MAGRKSGFSNEELAGRVAALPVITFPEELPVSARRKDIAHAIENHQVVIVSGETCLLYTSDAADDIALV